MSLSDPCPTVPAVSDISAGRRWAWRRVDPGLLMQRRPRHNVAPTIEEHLREPVGEQGWALVDVATGEPMVLVDDGYGSPTVAGGLFGPVADLLARAPELEAQVRLMQQALLSDSPALREQLRRNLAAQADLADEFGLLSPADVARSAGSSAVAPERLVAQWREQGRVFVVPTTDGARLPGFQFDERGVPLPAIAGVLTTAARPMCWTATRSSSCRRPAAWPRSCCDIFRRTAPEGRAGLLRRAPTDKWARGCPGRSRGYHCNDGGHRR